jgi:hypothetical protein
MERDAGSHSVDRIVRLFCLLTDPAPAGRFLEMAPIPEAWEIGILSKYIFAEFV